MMIFTLFASTALLFVVGAGAAALSAAPGPHTIPNLPICQGVNGDGVRIEPCYPMPIVGGGSCCGEYNISSWLAAGGRHIDTSCDYGSQPAISQAIAASGIARSDLWITSKLNPESYAENMTADLFSLVLEPLKTSYVDLILLHHAGRWNTDKNPRPACFDPKKANVEGTYYDCRMEAVGALMDIVKQGYAKTWGVSNWEVRELEQCFAKYGTYPPINQIEHYPWWRESETVAFCNKHGIAVESYAPVGAGDRSHMRDSPIFAAMGEKYGVTPGQLILSYDLQTGADIVIPRSANAQHQQENLALFTDDNNKNRNGLVAAASMVAQISDLDIEAIQGNHSYKKVYHTECQPWC